MVLGFSIVLTGKARFQLQNTRSVGLTAEHVRGFLSLKLRPVHRALLRVSNAASCRVSTPKCP